MKGKKYHKKIIFALLLVLAGLTGCTKKDNEFNNEFVYYHAYSYENYRYDTPAIEEDTLEKIANQKKSSVFYRSTILRQATYETKKHLLRMNAT